MNLTDAYDILRRVLDPMPLDTFLDDIVGRSVVKIAGDAQNYRASLLGSEPEDLILSDYERLAPRMGCHAALPIGPHPVIEPVADAKAFKAKVDAFFLRGYTVRLRDLRGLSLPLDEFLRALECVFHQPANVESFWSRDDARAPVHHDDVDLIIVQIKGRKRWFISTDESDLPNMWKTIPGGPPVMERFQTVEVGPGDMLYIPRGTQHRVDALSGSLHLSIGFIPLTMREAVIAALDHASEFDRRYRASIGGRLASAARDNDFTALTPNIREGIENLLKLSGSEEFITQAMQRRSSRAVGDLEKLKERKTYPPLSANTKLRHGPLAISHLMANPAKIDFSHPGGHIYIHRGAEESVKFIAATREFVLRDVPGQIGDDVRKALVAKFIDAGFLEIVED